MTLNAQERAAVEAAQHVADRPMTEREAIICDEATSEQHMFAILGHLSGFRAGVEAALEIARKAQERSARHENAAGCQAAATIINEIRALLAQEDEHGTK